MAGKGKLNVILDIDETLLQFVGGKKKERIPEDKRDEFDYLTDYFIARPHLDEFLKFLSENCATVNIWTWSDKPYADEVAQLIQDRVPGLKIANVWADSDADASVKLYGHNKDLNYIWYKKGKFDPCNTILIDDAADNTKNKSNYRNVIRVPEFNPTENADKALNDSAFPKVMEMLKAAMENPAFCSKGDLPFPFEDAKPGAPKTVGGKRRRKTLRRKTTKKGGAEPSVSRVNDTLSELINYIHKSMQGKTEMSLEEKDKVREYILPRFDSATHDYGYLKGKGEDVRTIDENLNDFYDKADELSEFPSKHTIPAGTEYLLEPPGDGYEIKNGDQLADFDGEYKFGRYYSRSEVDKLKGVNPYTRKKMSPVLYYTAVVSSTGARRTRRRRMK